MKKIYKSPVIAIIEADFTGIIAVSKPVVTFGRSNDDWQNEQVSDGYLDNDDNYSEIGDDTWGLSSR